MFGARFANSRVQNGFQNSTKSIKIFDQNQFNIPKLFFPSLSYHPKENQVVKWGSNFHTSSTNKIGQFSSPSMMGLNSFWKGNNKLGGKSFSTFREPQGINPPELPLHQKQLNACAKEILAKLQSRKHEDGKDMATVFKELNNGMINTLVTEKLLVGMNLVAALLQPNHFYTGWAEHGGFRVRVDIVCSKCPPTAPHTHNGNFSTTLVKKQTKPLGEVGAYYTCPPIVFADFSYAINENGKADITGICFRGDGSVMGDNGKNGEGTKPHAQMIIGEGYLLQIQVYSKQIESPSLATNGARFNGKPGKYEVFEASVESVALMNDLYHGKIKTIEDLQQRTMNGKKITISYSNATKGWVSEALAKNQYQEQEKPLVNERF